MLLRGKWTAPFPPAVVVKLKWQPLGEHAQRLQGTLVGNKKVCIRVKEVKVEPEHPVLGRTMSQPTRWSSSTRRSRRLKVCSDNSLSDATRLSAAKKSSIVSFSKASYPNDSLKIVFTMAAIVWDERTCKSGLDRYELLRKRESIILSLRIWYLKNTWLFKFI